MLEVAHFHRHAQRFRIAFVHGNEYARREPSCGKFWMQYMSGNSQSSGLVSLGPARFRIRAFERSTVMIHVEHFRLWDGLGGLVRE